MTQDLIAYLIVSLSALYLARRAVRRRGERCCGSRSCPAGEKELIQIGQPEETVRRET
jgi:hypothetical protein